MHCFNCRALIPEDLKFCPQCGTPVDETAEDVSAEQTLVEKPAAEEPAVEAVAAADLFEEELGFDGAESALTEDAEELPDFEPDEDSTLDPTSPDFDPRKFAGLDQEAFRPMAAAELLEEMPEDETEDAAPKAKKQGKGGIVALVIALVLVLAAAAAGLLYWLTMPTKTLVAEDNFVQFMGLDAEEKVTDFTVDARETNRFLRADTLWCSVVTEDGSVHAERDYVMNYRLTKEGWKLISVDELNTDTWIIKPMAGASLEEVTAALVGQKVKISDTYSYTLTARDVTSAEILSQDTNLETGADQVQVLISVVGELVGWTTQADMTMSFADGWQCTDFTHTEPEVEFKPGMEFELTQEDYLKALIANPIPLGQSEDDVQTTVVADGETVEAAPSAAQTVKVSRTRVSELTVLETVFDMEENTQTVVVEFLLDKQVAKLLVEAAISYVFEDGWKLSAVEYTPTVTEIVLDGEWKGVYPESEGKIPGVTLTIGKNEDGTDNNVFAFGPSEQSPYFFTGKYYVETVSHTETLEVALNATDWVLYYNPGGVQMVNLKGVLMIDDAVITDGQNFTITLQREDEAEEEETYEELAVTVTTSTAPETAQTETAQTETAQTETAQTETAQTETAQTETAAPEEDEDDFLGIWDTPVA